ARAMRNLPAVEGGDELVVPMNVLTGGQASTTDSGTQNQRGGHARRVKAVCPIEFELKAPAGDTIPAEETDPLVTVFRAHFKRQRAAIT
ncbi:hypothetical protein, partial [Escherichia coli]|uniref:hypothetical protein n=1 Tax=Escherichia coli TaxID=562 RepID=UPI001F4B7C68